APGKDRAALSQPSTPTNAALAAVEDEVRAPVPELKPEHADAGDASSATDIAAQSGTDIAAETAETGHGLSEAARAEGPGQIGPSVAEAAVQPGGDGSLAARDGAEVRSGV